MPATIHKPPHRPKLLATDAPRVFLAGSIDMGAAIEWQAAVEQALGDMEVVIFNPRRDDWDATWEQDISHDGFRGQVEWELDHLNAADLILFYFDPKGKAPVTMMELGLHASARNSLVCCPKGFWRRGNVQVICARYDLPMFETLETMLVEARMRLSR